MEDGTIGIFQLDSCMTSNVQYSGLTGCCPECGNCGIPSRKKTLRQTDREIIRKPFANESVGSPSTSGTKPMNSRLPDALAVSC